ncbi:MAG: DEAD/DEAH box helicase [Acidobacteria bacterium]|nr:DEAD/DEAH box helicase [Acidobacteriota bacterium]
MPPAPAPPDSDTALAAFTAITKAWFEGRFGRPTPIQSLAWPRIAAGEHVLATAPTGSGKTRAAFLWALDRLLSGAWEGGKVRVLYISPLKALNNDIQKNLLGPLAELERAFSAAGVEAESVRVGVRSGDTPAAERRKMLRMPPEILITTPESLNILLTKDRVRLLLDRYGIVFRELLLRETRSFLWSKLFRTLRLMELSGEIVGGHFFEGIAGLQFASHDAVRVLRNGLPVDSIYWMNAADPASPAGLGLEALKGTLPARKPSNHLVFHGSRPVVVSRGNGGRLEIAVAPDHPDFERYLGFLKNLLSWQDQPLRAIDLSEINGGPAAESAYAATFRKLFQATREGTSLRLRRRYVAGGEAG